MPEFMVIRVVPVSSMRVVIHISSNFAVPLGSLALYVNTIRGVPERPWGNVTYDI